MGRELKLWIIAVLVTYAGLRVAADIRDEVCKDLEKDTERVDADDEFEFDSYSFRVGIESLLASRTVRTDMFYLKRAKMLRVNMFTEDTDIHRYHDYEAHQTLTYSNIKNTKPRECKVDNHMRVIDSFLLVPNELAKEKEPTVADIFRLAGSSGFGNDIQLRKSSDTCQFRNLPCKKYVSCQKLMDEDQNEMIVKVTHLITGSFLEYKNLPIQISFEGKFSKGFKSGDKISQKYNIYHYDGHVDHDLLQTPLGVVCEGRNSRTDFPKIPPHLSFGQEIHEPDTSVPVKVINTIYSTDEHAKFVMETYIANKEGERNQYRLEDFETGLSYFYKYTSPGVSVCETKKISEITSESDFLMESDGTIQQRTPAQFFHSEGVEFHYAGTAHVDNGGDAEVWNGKDKESGYIYAWYFALNVKHSINDFAQVQKDVKYKIPLKRSVWKDESSEPTNTYFYKMDFTMPELPYGYDQCFKGNSKNVFIALPELESDVKRPTMQAKPLKRKLTNDIAKALGISLTRVNDLQFYYFDGEPLIFFNLLGAPNHVGDKVKGVETHKEISADEAYAKLSSKIRNKSLKFDMSTGKNSANPISGELIDSPYLNYRRGTSEGYSSGAMAGLAIGMMLVGLVGGGAGAFYFFIKRA